MKKTSLLFVGLGFLLLHTAEMKAQENIISRSELYGEPENYLQKQAVYMFEMVDEGLTANPPVIGSPVNRKLPLYLLDAMVHETKYDTNEGLFRFIESRTSKLIAELRKPAKKGLKIYKVYNEGFVAQTGTTTIAFDIVRGDGKTRKLIPDELIKQIADQCDILFLSHNHSDHADAFVIEQFIQAGKPVIAPVDIDPDNERITHLRSKKRIDRSIPLKNGKKVNVKIFPGHQGDLVNNLYVVTTEDKKTIAHIGDQANENDMPMLMEIHKQTPPIDALIINCWTGQVAKTVEGFAPKIVFTGHENEFDHTIDHREAFWLAFEDMKRIQRDYVIMGWGEWFEFK